MASIEADKTGNRRKLVALALLFGLAEKAVQEQYILLGFIQEHITQAKRIDTYNIVPCKVIEGEGSFTRNKRKHYRGRVQETAIQIWFDGPGTSIKQQKRTDYPTSGDIDNKKPALAAKENPTEG